MNQLEQTKTELAAVVRAYHAKGWSPATSTNYSFRLEADPTTIYVSRSGIDKSQFSAHDFMEVDLKGNPKVGFEWTLNKKNKIFSSYGLNRTNATLLNVYNGYIHR